MSTFTPGPWELDGDLLITKADPFEDLCFGRLSVGIAFGGDNPHATEALILAAPDLLEALEAAEGIMRCLGRLGASETAIREADKMAEVIAKARGEA